MAVLAGRVALVTGASAGIGAGLAAMLAAEGATVVLAARRETELAGVADGIRQRGGVAIPVVTDLSFLTVEDVADMARYLLHTGDNVKLGPQILLRTMRNPMEG